MFSDNNTFDMFCGLIGQLFRYCSLVEGGGVVEPQGLEGGRVDDRNG